MAVLKRMSIEASVVEALRPLTIEGGGYVRTLGLYRSELDAKTLLGEALRIPAVFVTYSGSTYSAGPALGRIETMSFTVISICAGRPGDDPYRVQEDVRGILRRGDARRRDAAG